MKRQYFTTPIYYVNGNPHIGHCYTGILTDVLARTAAMSGFEVRMQTGTDEHGNKVEQAAKAVEIENTIDFCIEISNKFRDLMLATNLCCSYNKFDFADNFYVTNNKNFGDGKNFIRTTDEKHKKFVQQLWCKLDENGWIYKDYYKGWYAMRDEAFYDESEIVDGKAPSGAPVEWKEEEAYFFRLSSFQDTLIKFYEEEGRKNLPDFTRQEMIAFMKGGLRDLCVSRKSVKWGIAVPSDSKTCNDSSHSIYVWLDALQNYISALDGEKEQWWDNVDKKTHVIGKDIARFHIIYWPAFLLASIYKTLPQKTNPNLIPNFVVHGWWLNNGEKMSKSLNNSLNPYDEIEFIKSRIDEKIARPQDLDALALDYFRYFLIKAMPVGNDGNYSRERLIETVNADLVNNIGNLASRVFNLIYKNPIVIKDFQNAYLVNHFIDIESILATSSEENRQIDINAPWNMIKQGKKEDFDILMLRTLCGIFEVTLKIRPIVPFIAESILNYMNIPAEHRNFLPKNYAQIVFDAIKKGFKQAPYPIVPRLKI